MALQLSLLNLNSRSGMVLQKNTHESSRPSFQSFICVYSLVLVLLNCYVSCFFCTVLCQLLYQLAKSKKLHTLLRFLHLDFTFATLLCYALLHIAHFATYMPSHFKLLLQLYSICKFKHYVLLIQYQTILNYCCPLIPFYVIIDN